MAVTSKKTLSGAKCEVLDISGARKKATAARHLVAAWKDTTLALGIIMSGKITNVSAGKRWLDCVCGIDRRDPVSTWHSLVKRYFHGDLKPPFNIAARNAARFSAAFYGPLATRDDLVASPEERPDA